MKVKHYLETITSVEIYPLITLVLFTTFFAGVVWYVLKMDKSKIEEISRIPLDGEEDSKN